MNGDGTGPGEYPGYDQYIRVWLPDGTPVPRDPANALPITLNAQAVRPFDRGPRSLLQ